MASNLLEYTQGQFILKLYHEGHLSLSTHKFNNMDSFIFVVKGE